MPTILRHVESCRQRGVDDRLSARLRWAMLHPETERKAFGARLAKVRTQAGYTLESAAKALTERGFTIGRGTIGAWETGRNVPDALALKWLARLYQVPVDVLYADAVVELETIQLAAKLRTVVLNETQSERPIADTTQQTLSRQAGKKNPKDELFNLTNRAGDASYQSDGRKKQGGRASPSGAGRPRRKG